MLDWRNHLFFLSVSLTPFVIADVAFPYVVGSDTDFETWRNVPDVQGRRFGFQVYFGVMGPLELG